MAQNNSTKYSTGSGASAKALRLLHVEDNLGFSRLVQQRLKHHPSHQFSFTAATTLAEAKTELSSRAFDVALLDLGLPDSKDLSTLTELRTLAPELPIVVLTGNDDSEIIDALITHGAQDYLHKNETNVGLIMRVIQFAIDRKRMEQKLTELAQYDGLTHLVNRTLFIDRLGHCLDRYERIPNKLALLFIDLDRFKSINDTLGHQAGDTLLQEVASRLANAVRQTDTVARFGGDEFCILLEDVPSSEMVIQIAEKILATLDQPFDLCGQPWYPYASIGIALSNGTSHAAELIKQADIAMYRAKQSGGHQYAFFTQEMQALAVIQANVDRALRLALEQEEFRTYFQPLVDLRTGQLHGAEALLRWQHPSMGLVGPAMFIPQLELSGQIVEVTQWVLRSACRIWLNWQRQNQLAENARLSVNLSPVMIRHPRCVEMIADILRELAFPPNNLVLEITESTFLDHQNRIIDTLNQLRTMGLRIAIDDFGTGYSSMSYLRYFNINCIKLDRSFIQGMAENPTDLSIAKSVIVLTRDLKVDLVAEGVDAQHKLDLLKALGCPLVQGFYFSRPLPEAEFLAYVQNYRPANTGTAKTADR